MAIGDILYSCRAAGMRNTTRHVLYGSLKNLGLGLVHPTGTLDVAAQDFRNVAIRSHGINPTWRKFIAFQP